MPASIRYEKIDDTGLAGPVTEMNGGLMAETTIYVAKRVVTMNPANPSGSAVAVRDGRVLGVGSVDELAAWGEHEIDDRFADKVLTPGFIETHCHSSTGGRWLNPYVGYFDRADPEGVIWKGCKDIFEVIDRLKALEAAMTAEGQPDDELLHVWGLDPLYFDGERMYASHLDTVSATRPIFVHHASGHLATVNSALMRAENITADSMTPGVVKGADGSPNGELQEPAAMSLATKAYAQMAASRMAPEALWNFGYEARNTGTTMVADLGTGTFEDPLVDLWRGIVEDDDFPMRVMLTASNIMGGTAAPVELAARTAELWRSGCSDKLRFGIVKLILDGSIQGFTARISYPHHYTVPGDSSDNGLWLTAPDQIADILDPYHRAGLTVHCHCNGDQATEAYVDAVEEVLERHPRWDHRHTVQHCQLTKSAQYRRMASLGMCANIFSNHIFYWGDQHRDHTVGPERARGMDACATAQREGVPYSIHSDSGVTPLGGLHVAWCAVNRLTATGDVLGEFEKISVEDAMYAITLGAAFQMKMDHEVGSIEAGKFADFAVLESDPFEVDPIDLKDIGVWGTVLGGVPFEAPRT